MSHSHTHPEIAIIGAGFSGLMTAANLMRDAASPLTIHLINDKTTFGKGAAYSTHSSKHLLNVPAAKISAINDQPGHFLDWVLQQAPYKGTNRDAVGKTFLPRALYGRYLDALWQYALANKRDHVKVNIIHDTVTDLDHEDGKYTIHLKGQPSIHADFVVLATGNEAPGNPAIPNEAFYQSKAYIKNPWLTNVAKLIKPDHDILIIGNGLTAVDLTISILETGFKGTIHTLSPRGFRVLPHRFSHIEYKDFAYEIKPPYKFDALYKLGYQHFRKLHRLGITAEPIVDSLRPYTANIWQSLSQEDKETFLREYKSTWNTIRHRVAPHLHDYIHQLRLRGKVVVHKGRLIDISEDKTGATVRYLSKKTATEETISAGLVINCTGPNIDISKSENSFIKALVDKGMIQPDSLHIGMDVTPHWTLIDAEGKENTTLFTLGGNLRGLYWETTAIPELRAQVVKLAQQLLQAIKEFQAIPVTVSK